MAQLWNRLKNAAKILIGKLEVEITISHEQYYCVVPSGVILKINEPTYQLPEDFRNLDKIGTPK